MSATAAYFDTYMLPKILISLPLLIMLVIAVGAYFVHRIDSQLARESEAKLKKLESGVIRSLGMFKNQFCLTSRDRSAGAIQEAL